MNFKKLVSLLLIVTLLFSFCFNSFATSLSNQIDIKEMILLQIDTQLGQLKLINPQLEKTFEKIKVYVNEGLDANQITEKLNKEELKSIISAYKQIDFVNSDQQNYINNNLISGLDQSIIKDTEELAKKYSEYKKIHGKFPVEIELDKDYSNQKVTISDATTLDPNFVALGYELTEAQVAAMLATLGQIVGTAFPYIALIALVAGCAIIVGSFIYEYYDYYSDVDEQVETWFQASSSNVVNASSVTRTMVNQRYMLGYRYWQAYLTDFVSLGGVVVDINNPISLSTATGIISANNTYLNVIAITRTDAITPCAAPGFGYIDDSPHYWVNGVYKPLNLWHCHRIYPGGIRGDAHSFYVYPW